MVSEEQVPHVHDLDANYHLLLHAAESRERAFIAEVRRLHAAEETNRNNVFNAAEERFALRQVIEQLKDVLRNLAWGGSSPRHVAGRAALAAAEEAIHKPIWKGHRGVEGKKGAEDD